jgi:uncharacterized protein
MSKRLPELIEPVRLAEKNSLLEGRVSLARMKRLAPSLYKGAAGGNENESSENQGELEVKLQFGIDENRQANIRGRIVGNIQLICQRCMQAMTFKVDNKVSLAIVGTDTQAANLPGYYEPLVTDEEGNVSLTELVEDELILALPTVAMHDIKECPAGDRFVSKQERPKQGQVSDADQDVESGRPNPFAVLEQLKKKKEDD